MKYKIAGVIFELETIYQFTKKLCENYRYFGVEDASLKIAVTKEDIEKERRLEDSTNEYLESVAVYRKLCEYIFDKGNGFVFHSSAVSVNGECYLFTAPSGTGKSTHVRLWKKLLNEKAVVINDDKPIIRCINGEFFVYGTPWSGKHRLDRDERAKLKAICEICRAQENSIKEVSFKEILPTLLNQTVRPKEIEKMDELLLRLLTMSKKIKTYKLCCNMDISAAILSYQTMSGENNEN
jgi:hypothetical protein